ncbi:MAG TPA: hypothetical protein VM536_22195 [Chloroflexia bacterium]|nr:hypothetical protein [Chloroflexia bacterium]
MSNLGHKIGNTTELTIVTDITAGQVEILRAVLQDLNAKRIFVPVEAIRFARFVIITPPGEDLETESFLLFNCAYNAAFEALVSELARLLPAELDAIWSHTRDWQGIQTAEQFKAWVLKHAVRANMAYTPYPQPTVKEIRKGLQVDNAVQELFDSIRSDPAARKLLEALES